MVSPAWPGSARNRGASARDAAGGRRHRIAPTCRVRATPASPRSRNPDAPGRPRRPRLQREPAGWLRETHAASSYQMRSGKKRSFPVLGVRSTFSACRSLSDGVPFPARALTFTDGTAKQVPSCAAATEGTNRQREIQPASGNATMRCRPTGRCHRRASGAGAGGFVVAGGSFLRCRRRCPLGSDLR